MLSLGEKGRDTGDHLQSDGLVVGVAGLAAQFPEAAPHGPRAEQQTLLAARADQVLKVGAVELLWVGSGLFKLAPQHLVRKLVGDSKRWIRPSRICVSAGSDW